MGLDMNNGIPHDNGTSVYLPLTTHQQPLPLSRLLSRLQSAPKITAQSHREVTAHLASASSISPSTFASILLVAP
ncbi:MAG: hypothetical protein IPO71_06850 [Nitrosomonas sp.]|nr:hypothetical protein [Nitrosomonas sp.]